MKNIYLPLLFSSLLLAGCGDKQKTQKDEDDKNQVRIEKKQEKTEVKTAIARKDRFEMELVSNGKVNAAQKATINFLVNDIVEKVYVKNGDRVRKGTRIASVDGRKAGEQLRDARLNMEKMKLELRSRLMSEGVNNLEDTTKIPQQRLQTIMLQCGYTSALNAYEKAIFEHNNIHTYAPFDGVVADLEAREYNPSSAYKSLCTLIDDSQMEVIFNVLETEINNLRPGMDVELTPYANNKETLRGKVTEVNPRIDENGMVKIKAVTDNRKALLVDGMNVSILVKRQIEDKLVIPKSAVLPRQGKKVVFVHKNGKAIWVYVTTGAENSREVSIESGLKEGDEVIYDNNLGLSHECDVLVIKP